MRGNFPGVPLIVVPGSGRPAKRHKRWKRGLDAVLLNAAVARAGDPVAMARAFGQAIEAGLMPLRDMAVLRPRSLAWPICIWTHLPDATARAALVTPNLPEATALTGLAPEASRNALATAFFAMGAGRAAERRPCWRRRGGRLVCCARTLRPLRFATPRKSGTRRSTGCTRASAIAHMARGDDLASACGHAKQYLGDWI